MRKLHSTYLLFIFISINSFANTYPPSDDDTQTIQRNNSGVPLYKDTSPFNQTASTVADDTALHPIITGISQLSARPGNVLTLTGSNFNTTANNNMVFFGAVATLATTVSATSLSVTVPSGATADYIKVLNTATGLIGTSKQLFTPVFTPVTNNLTTSNMGSATNYTVGTTAFSVASSDLDGDGKPDLAVTNYTSGTVSVLRNISTSGSPAFATPVNYTVGSQPRIITIGDIDGDGKPDLAVVNLNSNNVSVLRNTSNNGTISFAAAVHFPTLYFPISVAIGDLDGDGRPDLAIAKNASNRVSVLRNTGSIGSLSFAGEVDYIVGTENPRDSKPYSITLGDLDGDAKPELVVANFGTNTIVILHNTSSNGNLSFVRKVDVAIGNGPTTVTIADLDGDGKPDVAAGTAFSKNVYILRNTSSMGNLTFAQPTFLQSRDGIQTLSAADINGDGKPDLVLSLPQVNKVSVLRNISNVGNIKFANYVDYATGTYPYSAIAGDLDGDGKPDLVVANWQSNNISVLHNLIDYSPDSNGTLYVKKGGTGAGDSWDNAMGEVADALKFAKNNNGTTPKVKQIWVAGGTYNPMYSPADNNFGNPDTRSNAFLLVKDVKLYGGFAGTETSPDQRNLNISTNKSILSGDLDNDGIHSNNDAYHVLISTGESGTAELNGFTIIGGNTSNTSSAILVNGTSIYQYMGGGMYSSSSSPKISNCHFSDNAAKYGAAIYNEGATSPAAINNCNFTNNKATEYGGAIYNYLSSPIITKSNFSGNKATINGGALYNHTSSPLISYCMFSGNSADNTGGAIFNIISSPKISNSIFSVNSAKRAGVLFNDTSSPKINNSLFVKNNALTDGAGAIWHNSGNDFTLTNCTIYGNTGGNTTWAGGIHAANTGFYSLYNSVVWDNEGGQLSGGGLIKNSLIQGFSSTANGNLDATNISTGQLFKNPNGQDGMLGTADDDFNLQTGSPLIDKGDNTLYSNNGGNLTTDQDLAGNIRLQGTKIDISAYEKRLIPQTITASDMTKTYGDIPFVPTATASSGLEVSYVSADNNIAEAFQDSADGNKWKLKIKKAGQVNITAKQAGNDTYNPATDVVFKLTINKAPLTITADAKSKEFGTADPILTFSTNGLANGDTQAVIFGALRRTIGETIGTYRIAQGTLTAANYTINYTGADFTITNAPGDFITVWDMTKVSNFYRITVRIATLPSPNNLVKYYWTTPNGNSGVGTVTTSGDLYINPPSNQSIITLHIKPENLAGFVIFNDPRLVDVTQWGTAAWRDMENALLKCSNLNITATDIPDLSRVTNMRAMFSDCVSLTGPANIGSWDTSNVTNMAILFSGASVFNQDISNWNTANVILMPAMFRNARSFNQNIGNWNTVNVADMEGMFDNTVNFNQDIGSWNTANVTNMSKMFYMALSFNQDIGNWNTANVTNMRGMFSDAYAFNANIGNWDTANVTNMGGMFSYTRAFNQNIGRWNTGNVTNMESMFWYAQAFNQDIGNWNTANVISMAHMFRYNPAFNQDISNWNTAKVTTMENMFQHATNFNQDIGRWSKANVTTMENMFQGALSFNQNIGSWQLNPIVNMSNMLAYSGLDCANYSATLRGWANNPNTPSGRNLGALDRQYGSSALAARTLLTTTKGWTITGDSPSGAICGRPFVTVWDMSKSSESQSTPTSLRFGITTLPNKPVNYTWTASGGSSGSGTFVTNSSAEITGLPAGEIITLSIASEIKAFNIAANSGNDKRRLVNVAQWGDAVWSTMENAFSDCVNLNVTATDIPNLSTVRSMRKMFNNCQSMTGPANIGSWNTTTVNNMDSLFTAALVFDQDISSWNTANVTNMAYLFSGARAFNQDLSNWNTTNATNMEGMFQETRASNLNISNWNTQNVRNMQGMFAYSPVFNEDINNWNTSNVTNMSNMFRNSEAFNQNISTWNTTRVTDMSGMFAVATSFNQPIGNWNTASVTNMFIMFASAKNFNQDIGNWNTSAVTNMSGMFDSTTAFNKPLGNWNTAAVTDMHGMFNRASSFNQDISSWNMSSVLRIGYMLVSATAFNQNIGNWQFNPNVDMTNMLDYSGMDCQNYSLTLNGWANNPNIPSGRNLGAQGRQYGTNAAAARTALTTAKGWTISGDRPSGQNCGLPQTITATDMTKTYGDVPFVPTTTASSGLEVSYVSADNSIAEAFQDSADGNKWKLKINKAGVVNITAKQTGNDTYIPAADIIFTLTINKAALTITANALSKEYGTADPTLTYTATGFVNGDDQTALTGTLSRASGEAVGTYAISQGTLDAENYSITYTGEDFTITAATGDFVIVWDISQPGGWGTGSNIMFDITIPPGKSVDYFWSASGGSTGRGTITNDGNDAVSLGMPANEIITLNLKPTHLKGFSVYFYSTGRIIDVSQWGSAQWEKINRAFQECKNMNVTAIDIPDFSRVTNMSRMFYGCTSLIGTPSINNWNTQNVITMESMFEGAKAFNQNIGNWNTENVTDMRNMFASTDIFNQDISNWNTENVTNMGGMFGGAKAFNQNIGNWNTANVTDMSFMFSYAEAFNQDLSNWNTENVMTMESMFSATEAFNQDIGNWNTENVTFMFGMFYSAKAFNQDISNWNTANVTNMGYMFGDAKVFNQNIGNWNTVNVTDMAGMFSRTQNFNQNIGNWNTANVTDMRSMFNGAEAFNQDIGNWNTANVIYMRSMFKDAKVFNQDIGTWQLNPNVDMTGMLDNSGMDCQNYSLTLQGWAANPNTPSGHNLGAQDRQYGTNAEAARTALTTTKGWTITGDSPSGLNCGLSQTITANDMTKTYGDIPFVPTATASSGLEVSYVSADNSIAEAFQDSADGNKWKLKINKAGVVNITAQQAGNDTYAPAADVIFTLTINKAALTITANAHSKIYGTTDPTLTYIVNGLVNGDTEAVISGSLTRPAGENVGTYAIEQGTVSAENYVITYTGADFNITKATLNIVADAKSKAFGTTDPSLTYTVSGLVNGETESIITGSLSRTAGEAVGIYAITQGTLSAGDNYDITFTGADFTIIEMLVVDTSTQTNVTCNGGSDGSATVSITGGTAPYTYSWSPNGGTAATATGLVAGDYTVTITDANGSTITKDFNITEPQAVDPPTADDVQEFCRAANPTISDLEIVGTQVRWYASATATQELPENTLLVDGMIYYASQTINGCENQERTLVIITLNDQLPTPQGAPIQDLEEGATIADLVVTPSNVVWYASYDDAVNNINPLSPTTELENGTTYYAIAMADGQCSSLPFAVTVNVTLGVGKPQEVTFKYYPNPVEDYLNIQSSGTIDAIEVYSLLGQLVKKQDFHSGEVRLFLGDLSDGTYAVSILSEGKKSTVKIIKK
ncbi:BspA family leucine-rich repeat surface protein [Flavobacterium microcysteis]